MSERVTVHRTNRRGVEYELYSIDSGTKTEISQGKEIITVNHSIVKVNYAWNCWMMRSFTIQRAFDFFTDSERKFLMAGFARRSDD